MDRSNRVWTTILAAALAWISLIAAGAVHAANTLPLSDAWSITSSGKAESSGALLFRVTQGADANPVEVTVFVLSGSNETGVASSIRRALSAHLDQRRFNVASGEGANVLVSAEGTKGGFALELVDSDVENVRVVVRSATPVAPPTVPPQQVPANPPEPAIKPTEPGNAAPPPESAPPAPSGESSDASGGAGAPASAPPPPPGEGNQRPLSDSPERSGFA